MATVFDYLDWRGDLEFRQDPFNFVDNVILSEVAYTVFKGIVPGPECTTAVTLQEASDRFYELWSEEDIKAMGPFTYRAPELMKKLVKTRRFGKTKITGYIDIVSQEYDYQIAAMTFLLEDGTSFVAFRGSDQMLVGWKEDFMLTYKKETIGQRFAMEYLNHNFKKTTEQIRVGGHSKGGNFAVFAAAFCKEEVKERILQVYSNDGPGFIESVIQSPGYQDIKDRIVHIIPYESMIGILLDLNVKSLVVKSESKGIMAHDGMTWQVMGNQLVSCESLSASSVMLQKVIEDWIKDLDASRRESFITTIFDMIEKSGYQTTTELKADLFHTIIEMGKMVTKMSKQQQKELEDVISKLSVSTRTNLIEELKENNRWAKKLLGNKEE